MHKTIDTLIIGAGFAGIGAAIQLKKQGIKSFLVLERKSEVGGTWRDNTYPGCACDIPSFLYSYSFELNPEWSESFSPHNEILDYLKFCVKKYGIEEHIIYDTPVEEVRFDTTKGNWKIKTKTERNFEARTIISCSGPLNEPSYPEIKNREAFKEPQFHSLHWQHDLDLTNKRIAVIGTGASAIQFIPKIAETAKEITVFQRTAPWVSPKNNQIFTETAKNRFRKFPSYMRFWRELVYWLLELRGTSQYKDNKMRKWRTKEAMEHLNTQISDPVLREKLTPNYTIGCKRILISDEYYPTLTKEHVHLETDTISAFTEKGVLTQSGKEVEVDVIIYGTGFKTTTFSHIYKVIGLNNRSLFEEWNQEGGQAFKGINVNGFPNFMITVGPNTGLGHNSIIHMMESQYKYILDYLKKLSQHPPHSYFDLKIEKQKVFNTQLQKELEQMVWTTGGCQSYYLKNRAGKNTSIWPGSTMKYRKLTKKVKLSYYNILTPDTSH